VSDEGSGAVIGRDAIRAALYAHDGMGPGSGMTAAILDRLGGSPAAVVAWVNTARPADYGRLAPLVLAAATEGDPVARRILTSAGSAVADLVRGVLGLGAPAVCLMGGLADPIRPWLPADILSHLVAARGDAMDGALLLARTNLGDSA